jgi:putative acetyltransferase
MAHTARDRRKMDQTPAFAILLRAEVTQRRFVGYYSKRKGCCRADRIGRARPYRPIMSPGDVPRALRLTKPRMLSACSARARLTGGALAMPGTFDPHAPLGFSIRLATNNDIRAIRSVLLSVRSEYGVLGEIAANDADLDDLDACYFRQGGHFEVVEDAQRQIVGCVGLYPRSQHRAELCKMYLEKSARGRGLGRRLLENVLRAARRGGFSEVWLETNSVLTEAITLYAQYGFQPVDSDHLLPRCDQAYLLRLE